MLLCLRLRRSKKLLLIMVWSSQRYGIGFNMTCYCIFPCIKSLWSLLLALLWTLLSSNSFRHFFSSFFASLIHAKLTHGLPYPTVHLFALKSLLFVSVSSGYLWQVARESYLQWVQEQEKARSKASRYINVMLCTVNRLTLVAISDPHHLWEAGSGSASK